MSKILYVESLSGISGDMTIGALLDLGIEFETLKKELSKIKVDGYEIKATKQQKNGITGTKFDVILESECIHSHEGCKSHVHSHEDCEAHTHSHEEAHEHSHEDCEAHTHSHEEAHEHSHEGCEAHTHSHEETHEHHHRNLEDIENIIDKSDLSDKVKQMSKTMFGHVARAESKIHDKPLSEVHFHEVGALDSIVDIIGTAICIDLLQIDEIVFSPIHTGTGFVKCAHGKIPVPAPATLEILKEIPIYSTGIRSELVTPTGAAIAKTLADRFEQRQEMIIESIGYGLGTKDLEITNVLRMSIGKKKHQHH